MDKGEKERKEDEEKIEDVKNIFFAQKQKRKEKIQIDLG